MTQEAHVTTAATAQALHGSSRKPRVRDVWEGILRLASGSHVLAWADQGMVSATNFLALLMIGRWSGASELGAYAIGTSAVVLLLAAQEALITRPYTIQLNRPVGTQAEHAFSTLLLSCALAAAAALALAAGAAVLSLLDGHRELVRIVAALAAATPFMLMREFARRFAFAHLEMRKVLMLDGAVAALNVVLLAWFGWTGNLSAVTGFAALGGACAVGAVGWLCLAHTELAYRLDKVRATLAQSWGLGKWLLVAQGAMQAQGYTTYWLCLLIAGAKVTGVYAACMSIIAFANPLLFGFINILTPRAVRTLRAHGGEGLRRQAARDAALLVAALAPFCLIVLLFGERVMQLLYPGADYAGNGPILAVLAFSVMASAAGAPAHNALASAERARSVAAVVVPCVLLYLVLVWWCLTQWGLLGAAYGVLVAEAAGSIARWIAFLRLVPKA